MDELKKKFAMNALRRSSYRWPGRYKATKKAHVGRKQYKCESCNNIFSKKETQLDHVIPVVDPIKGFTGFDEWIDRLYAYESGWQLLCLSCHNDKTQAENKIRREHGIKEEEVYKKKTKKKVDKSEGK